MLGRLGAANFDTMGTRSLYRRGSAGVLALAICAGLAAQPVVPGGVGAEPRLATHQVAHSARPPHVVHPVAAPPPVGPGYWLVGRDGGVFAFGSAGFFGSSGGRREAPGAPGVAGIAAVPDGSGYWLASSTGAVAAFGGAHSYGSWTGRRRSGRVVGIASATHGTGYWLATSKGAVLSFGSARFFGSKARAHLGSPIVAFASTPDGDGYWLAAADGAVYRFGDARRFGPKARAHLGSPIVAFAPTPDGRGYWLAAANGGVAPFGDAAYRGSMRGRRLRGRVVGIVANPLQASSGALEILTAKLAAASVSAPYAQTLSASGGLPPYSWKVTGGQLAPGLVLDGLHGVIEGAPTGPAVDLLTVQVEDRMGAIATRQLTLVAGPAPVALGSGEGALAVSIDWLPPGVAASVVVRGPGGFRRSLGGTIELVVKPGTYLVSASKVDDGTDTFYPGVTGSPVRVEAGKLGVAGVNYLTEVADTTKVVGERDLSDLRSISGQSLTFSPPPSSLAGVQAGDVVVAGPSANAPGGFLRRVTSVSLADGTLVLNTASAGLAQAVPRGSFSVDWPSNTASQRQVSSLLPGSGAQRAQQLGGVQPPAPHVSGPGVSTAWPWAHPTPPQADAARRRPQDGTGGVCSSSYPCQMTVKPPGNAPPVATHRARTRPTTLSSPSPST